jgi:selenocysteine lyase/cysteine desulfurase
MKDSFDALKKTVFDEVVKTSRNYVLREQVRAELTDMVRARISSGHINSAEDVQAYIQALKAAVGILENVPFENWQLIDRVDR